MSFISLPLMSERYSMGQVVVEVCIQVANLLLLGIGAYWRYMSQEIE